MSIERGSLRTVDFKVRNIPLDVHTALKIMAAHRGVSMNQIITDAIIMGVAEAQKRDKVLGAQIEKIRQEIEKAGGERLDIVITSIKPRKDREK